jgi:mono/diheme cytochrome c family protein
MKDFGQLMQEVFTGRMSGPKVDTTQVAAMNTWIDRQAAFPIAAPRDPDAVARGKALFNDGKVACATCHKGNLLTDNTNRLVGTGSALQVPSLRGLAARAPYMHDGCAKTLLDRFTDTKCGGGDTHGVTSHLGQPELLDLVAYLETL